MSCRRLDLLSFLLFLPSLAWATDEEALFFKSVADVNDGDLKFLVQTPDKPLHHHQNRITIDDASLHTGWVRLEQCHANLDAVPSTQVVYREDSIRDLHVVRAERIGRAWIEGDSVQLENVGRNALLCIEADTRALSPLEGGSHYLRNGPYMRRFLDGYYPMRVSLSVRLATPRLRFVAITPEPQPGFHVEVSSKGVDVQALFEGRLNTEMRFDLIQP